MPGRPVKKKTESASTAMPMARCEGFMGWGSFSRLVPAGVDRIPRERARRRIWFWFSVSQVADAGPRPFSTGRRMPVGGGYDR